MPFHSMRRRPMIVKQRKRSANSLNHRQSASLGQTPPFSIFHQNGGKNTARMEQPEQNLKMMMVEGGLGLRYHGALETKLPVPLVIFVRSRFRREVCTVYYIPVEVMYLRRSSPSNIATRFSSCTSVSRTWTGNSVIHPLVVDVRVTHTQK